MKVDQWFEINDTGWIIIGIDASTGNLQLWPTADKLGASGNKVWALFYFLPSEFKEAIYFKVQNGGTYYETWKG